jgi:hypothetical protein
MANRFKELPKEEVHIEEEVAAPLKPAAPKKKSGVVKSLTTVFSGTFLSNETTLRHIPFILFLSFIAIFYIANGYWADDKIRQMNKINTQLKELRSEYISTKSDLMFISKQSEVAKSVEKMGLKEPIAPPLKIVVKDTLSK